MFTFFQYRFGRFWQPVHHFKRVAQKCGFICSCKIFSKTLFFPLTSGNRAVNLQRVSVAERFVTLGGDAVYQHGYALCSSGQTYVPLQNLPNSRACGYFQRPLSFPLRDACQYNM
jgi:hypothetical protein